MKNKILSISTVALMGAALVLSMSPSFAATTTTTTAATETKEKPKMPENMIFGKITAISKDSMTISVATMKDRPERKGDEKMAPPEKPNDDNKNKTAENTTTPPEKPADDGTKKEKPDASDMFTLTGETKTINISSATFGHDGKKPDDDKKSNDNKATTETEKTKTYADYSVGDYVGIELTNSTSTVAKSVREAFGGPMGGGPKDGGKAPEKK